MNINSFKALRFDQNYWTPESVARFENFDTRNKVQRTRDILSFVDSQISRGIAKVDMIPSLYVMRMTTPEKSVTSIVGEINYDDKSIFFPNEEVHNEKLETYRKIFEQYRMQICPVLTFYKGLKPINSIVDASIQTTPTISSYVKNVKYELWKINDGLQISNIQKSLSNVKRLYIADGHHRFSMFDKMNTKTSAKIVVSVTDADSILLKSCHRVIFGDIDKNWRAVLSKHANIAEKQMSRNSVILKLKNGGTYYIDFKNLTTSIGIYDYVKKYIITEALNISEFENRMFPLPGSMLPQDSLDIFRLYRGSEAILFIPPTTTDEFLNIIECGEKLPPTSTWFEPKIIDGFIMRKY